MKKFILLLCIFTPLIHLIITSTCIAQEELPYYLKDRGTGIPTSMFGTYINKGEFIIYPYYEFYYDHNAEYAPEEFGYSLDVDYRGLYRGHEGLIFLGYGITNRLAVEFEAAVITATLYKSGEDKTAMPDKIEESGLGDIESQLRWRWFNENIHRPELFSYFETVFPLQKNRKLIGTKEWEFQLGTGIVKGFSWGTITLRLAAEYETGEHKIEFGEYAVEYLKRFSKLFRFMIAVEGSEDEVEFITDLQFHISPNAFIRINNAFGITSKAEDYAPEIGILFHF